MQHLKGIGASAGIAIAKAYRLEEPDLTVQKKQSTTRQLKQADLNQQSTRQRKSLNKFASMLLRSLVKIRRRFFLHTCLSLVIPNCLTL